MDSLPMHGSSRSGLPSAPSVGRWSKTMTLSEGQ